MSTSNIRQVMDNLGAEITRNSTVDGSARTLIQSLAAKVEELKNDPAALQAYVDQLRQSSDDLTTAITANTPAVEG